MAWSFDGTNDKVTFGKMSFCDGSNFSVCGWGYTASTADQRLITNRISLATGHPRFEIVQDSSGFFSGRTNVYQITVGDEDTTTAWAETANSSNVQNAWVHVGFSCEYGSATGLKVYINGSKDANDGDASSLDTVADWTSGDNPNIVVGCHSSDLNEWNGSIAECAIWSRVLTAGEWAALGKGYSPLHFPNGLEWYAPLNTATAVDIIAGQSGSVTPGAAKGTTHPNIIYPPSYNKGNLYLNRRKVGEPASSGPSCALLGMDTYVGTGTGSPESHTFSSVPIGDAANDRYICLLCYMSGTADDFDTVTIGGATATQVVTQASNVDNVQTALYIAAVHTGTTADIVIQKATGASDTPSGYGYIAWRMTGVNPIAYDTGSTNVESPDDTLTTTVDVPARSVVLAGAFVVPNGSFSSGYIDADWVGATSEGGEVASNGAHTVFAASETGVKAQASRTITMDATALGPLNGDATNLVAASFTASKSSPYYLIDTYPGAVFAYSFRKLKSDYSGAALRLRRASDNTELDIGFDNDGNFDIASATSFLTATSGFITTWYDQSGNGNHVSQGTEIDQPYYDATGGPLGVPCAGTNGETRQLETTLQMSDFIVGEGHFNFVVEGSSSRNTPFYWNAATRLSAHCPWDTGSVFFDWGGTGGTSRLTIADAGASSGWHTYCLWRDSANEQGIRRNGSTKKTGTGYTTDINSGTATWSVLGGNENQENMVELVVWGSDLGETDRFAIEAEQNAYWHIW